MAADEAAAAEGRPVPVIVGGDIKVHVVGPYPEEGGFNGHQAAAAGW